MLIQRGGYIDYAAFFVWKSSMHRKNNDMSRHLRITVISQIMELTGEKI